MTPWARVSYSWAKFREVHASLADDTRAITALENVSTIPTTGAKLQRFG